MLRRKRRKPDPLTANCSAGVQLVMRALERRTPLMLPAIAAGLAAAGCNLSTGPAPLPEGAVAFTPPAHYASWWAETELCAGQAAQYDDVRWFVVPDAETFELRGKEWAGWWWQPGNRIILADGYREHAPTVRHEMLHAILQRGDHPTGYFAQRCADVVEP